MSFDDDIKNKIKDLSEEVKRWKSEIDRVEKNLQDLTEKMQKGKKAEENPELKKMLNDVSDLFNFTFNIMGASGNNKATNNKAGFIDIINSLNELSEKTESIKKDFSIAGKKGVIEYKISARPLKGQHVAGHQSIYKRLDKEQPFSSKIGTLQRSMDKNEPIIEFTENGDDLIVLVEIPNLDEEKIIIDVDQDKIKIYTGQDKNKIIEENLPKKVDKTSMKKTYINGVLEITLKKETSK